MEKEILKELTVTFAKEMLELLKSTKEFVVEQSPLIIQELINWEIVNSIAGTLMLWVISAALLIISWKYIDYKVERYDVLPPPVCPKVVLSGVAGVLLLASTACIMNTLKVLVAPRVFLIEYFSNLVR